MARMIEHKPYRPACISTNRINHVFTKSPAGRAKLEAGILIEKINGVSVVGKNIHEALMAGTIGTEVRLDFASSLDERPSRIELTKEKYLTQF